jgi:hypothetical protein
VKCGVNFTVIQAQKFIDENFTLFGKLRRDIADLFNKCGPVDHDNAYSIYLGRKCQYDIQFSKMTTIKDLRNEYLEFLEFGSKSLCLMQSDETKNEILAHKGEYAKRLDLWTLALK